MKTKLLPLIILSTLTACGGGGGGSSATTDTSTNGAGNSGTQPSVPALQPGEIIARFNQCPNMISTAAKGVASCLAGTYTGTDVVTGEACTIRIEASGSTVATRGALKIEMAEPNIGPVYGKYSTTPSASSVSYTLNWVAAHQNNDTFVSKKISLNFNAQNDNKLTIEAEHAVNAQTQSVIHCGMQL